MEIKAAICEDDENQTEYLAMILKKWAAEHQYICRIEIFRSAEAFLFEYDGDKTFDILLLDIEMGKMNGVELAKKIRSGMKSANDRIQIIFITGFPDFLAEGYEVEALHYLLKPVSYEKLGTVLDRAVLRLETAEKYFLVTFERSTQYIPISQIFYVEAQKQYVQIVAESGIFRMKASLTDTAGQLDEYFFQCHRSFLVNLRYVNRVTRDIVFLKNGLNVPVSRKMSEAIMHEMIRLF